ncbi:azurin [Pseudomonas monteilii]|uniref:azurin n=1 Tax=Pseudomonas TaxID=286 RepID=UPI00048FA4F6|nr:MULTISPECIES: azurin [Pseudomonas]MBA1314505.1 azurin [Pseudomonas monteilii]MCE1018257.1 azurin [Pseudomonas monteilii]MCE1034165.1 azurin [Pseudomonas monteilii]MCE1087045.1 azurin [Pseudomonas monteilii]MDH0019870.1 azurin [Pseudomonas monteilii]
MFRPALAFFALTLSSLAWSAEPCSVDIHSTDQMTYDLKTITVPQTCQRFTVNLLHTGTLPRYIMGHNWVLAKKDDIKGVTTDGAAAGEADNYLQPGDKRVLAHTRLIGGGEKDSVTFDTGMLQAGQAYAFFCSYPFHSTMMKGTLTFGTSSGS